MTNEFCLWPPNSNQLICECKRTFVSSVKRFPQGVLEISCSQYHNHMDRRKDRLEMYCYGINPLRCVISFWRSFVKLPVFMHINAIMTADTEELSKKYTVTRQNYTVASLQKAGVILFPVWFNIIRTMSPGSGSLLENNTSNWLHSKPF